MATYLLHYCYYQPAPVSDDFMEHVNNPKLPVQVHGRWLIELVNDLEYVSDVTWIESFLSEEHFKQGNIGCSNFQLLGWQRLSGQNRPAEAV
ncbi:hypothetical protein ACF8GB_20385 [Pseudomonas sp. xss_4]|uniref:hypothetical protein n=1 Tax=Pseudomonas sp. xss_4 TaxID=3367216 RepID=UPI00370AC26E